MTDRKSNFTNAAETTLASDMSSTDLTATVVTTVGFPASPCYLVIDADDPTKREYIYFDGTFSGTTFVTTALGNRYQAGSAGASGISHLSGAEVKLVATAQAFTDLHDRIDADASAYTTHLSADSHTSYLNVARHDLTARHGSSVVDHGSAGGLGDDDHGQYLNVARHDLTARHGSGVVDHGSTGGLGDDDHGQYLNSTRHNTASHTSSNVNHSATANLGSDTHTQYLNQSRHLSAHDLVGADQNAGQITLAVPFSTMTGAELNVTTQSANAKARIIGTFDFAGTATGAGLAIGECQVDGVSQSGEVVLDCDSGGAGRGSVSRSWVVVLASAGSHNFKLRARKELSGGTAISRGPHTGLTVEVID